MNFLLILYYSLVNGFIVIGNLFYINWYWIIGIVFFFLIFVEENKEIEEEYDDIERTIL